MTLQKIPPQALDLEEAVLGAMMIENESLVSVIDLLKPTVFYKPEHSLIFEAICELFNESKPVDILTVTERLRVKGVLGKAGEAYKVAELTTKVNSAANIESHARILIERYVKRQLIKAGTKLITNGYDDTIDPFKALSISEEDLSEAISFTERGGCSSMQELIDEHYKNKMDNLDNPVCGLATGINDLDRYITGFQDADLIILAARPAMGKTALALSILIGIAKQGVPSLLFSLEMGNDQIGDRMLSHECNIPLEVIKKPYQLHQYQIETINNKVNHIRELPIHIEKASALTIMELRAKANRLISSKGIKFIAVDYLQLMSGSGGGKNREQEISEISRGLKAIAKDFNIPVLALSQLSRAVETRGGDKRPMLSDLRESGSIEQDADMVMFLYRPEYYGIMQDEEGYPLNGIGQVIVAKYRQGNVGDVPLKFVGKYTRWESLDM